MTIILNMATPDHTSQGKRIGFNIEVDCADIDAFWAEMRADGMVRCWKLFTKPVPGEAGVVEIVGRRAAIVGLSAVHVVETPGVRFVEFEKEKST